jgi:hypothetical protein
MESDSDYPSQQRMVQEVFGMRVVHAFMYSFGLGFNYAQTMVLDESGPVLCSLPRLLLETMYGGELSFDGRGSSTFTLSYQESDQHRCIKNVSTLGEFWSTWTNTLPPFTREEAQAPRFFRRIREWLHDKHPTRMRIVQSTKKGGDYCLARMDLVQQRVVFTYSDPIRQVTRSLTSGTPEINKAFGK